MTKLIRVDIGVKFKEFDSLSEATTVASKIRELNKSKIKLIEGSNVINYQFSGFYLVIFFENNKYMTISPGENAIDWDIVSVDPGVNVNSLEEEICFEFPSGRKHNWNWRSILDSFIGREIVIAPSDQYLFLYTKGGNEIKFSSLVDTDKPNTQYLFISEV